MPHVSCGRRRLTAVVKNANSESTKIVVWLKQALQNKGLAKTGIIKIDISKNTPYKKKGFRKTVLTK